MRHLFTLAIGGLLVALGFTLRETPKHEPVPPLMFRLSDGTQWPAPDEDAMFDDAFSAARDLGRTVVVTQSDRVVMIADPNHK